MPRCYMLHTPNLTCTVCAPKHADTALCQNNSNCGTCGTCTRRAAELYALMQ